MTVHAAGVEPGDYVLWYEPTKDGKSIKRTWGRVVARDGLRVVVRQQHRVWDVPIDNVRIAAPTMADLNAKLSSPEHQDGPAERAIRRHWDEILRPRHNPRRG